MSSVTINGHTYTDDTNASTGLAAGGHRTRFIPLIQDVVAVAGDIAADAAAVLAESPADNATAAAGSAAAALVSQNAAAVSAAAALVSEQNAAAISESGLPSQTGNNGKALTTNGTMTQWTAVLKSTDIDSTVQAYDTDTAKLDVAQTWTAQQTFAELKETVYDLTGTEINPANSSIQTKTLTGNTTFTEALESGQTVVLMIDDGTTYTVTWPTTTWKTNSGVAPTLLADGYTTIVLWKVSTTLYGVMVGDA